MAKWRLAKSLEQLRAQINQAYPSRSKVSDGTVGDIAHSARASDHNPNAAGVVCAFDCTHDSENGCDAQDLADALVVSRDERIKYLIWNKRMCSSYPAHGKPAWTWRPYSGSNPHQKHIHVSVQDSKILYDSVAEWDIGVEPLLNGEAEESATVATSTTTTTTTDAPPAAPVTVVEEKSSVVATVTGNEKIKEIAGTGLSTIGNKLATGGISTGVLSAVGAFFEKAWPVLIFAGVLIVLGVVIWLVVYNAKQKEKQMAAAIAADPSRTDIVFK